VLMKRIPALVLLAVLLVNAAGFYVYYVIELQRIHSAMRAHLRTLPDHALTRLSLTPQGYRNALVEEDEIRVSGDMFDVGRVKITADSIIVYALHDEREDDLIGLVNDIISKPFNPDADVASYLVNYLSLTYLPVNLSIQTDCVEGYPISHQSAYLIRFNSICSLEHFQPPRYLPIFLFS
jgi:hypothetical protein